MAHYLRRLGVGPEVLVGIYMERSLGMAVGQLAVLKAGGAYVPLDTSYPKERLAYMLEDAQVSVLLTQQRLIESLPETAAQLVCLHEDSTVTASENDQNLTNKTTGDNLAYVIYTSGSTGQPKGVGVSHRVAAQHLTAIRETFDLDPSDRRGSVRCGVQFRAPPAIVTAIVTNHIRTNVSQFKFLPKVLTKAC